jgi:dihydrofolate reductase
MNNAKCKIHKMYFAFCIEHFAFSLIHAMLVSIIVAVSENGVIGRGGELPWHLSNDLRRFKEITLGHTVIMGRRTWESIGRPLPGRRMVVISRRADFQIIDPHVKAVSSLEDALRVAASKNDDEAFIIGGAELYRAALPVANRLYLTRVHATVEGDAFFPAISWNGWRLLHSQEFAADAKNDHPHSIQVYEAVGQT